MKKLQNLFLSGIILFSLSACNNDKQNKESAQGTEPTSAGLEKTPMESPVATKAPSRKSGGKAG